MKYALQLSKEFEDSDPIHGEIIGIVELDEKHSLFDHHKAVAQELVANPENYPLIWKLMAQEFIKYQDYFESYKARGLAEFMELWEDCPEDFRINLESMIKEELGTESPVYLISEEKLLDLLPKAVETLDDADLVNFLVDETPYQLYDLELTCLGDFFPVVDLTATIQSD